MITLLQRSAILGACVSVSATLVVAPAYADPNNYSFELAGADQSIVIISLKNTLSTLLVPDASIDCTADVGPQDVTTMTVPMLAHPGTKKGEYVLVGEPGMKFFDVDLVAEVPGETQLVTGKLHITDQNGQGQNNNQQ
jgi:hypothetical protein